MSHTRRSAVPLSLALTLAALAACNGTDSVATAPLNTPTAQQDRQVAQDVATDVGDAVVTALDVQGATESMSGSLASVAPANGPTLDLTVSGGGATTTCTGPDAGGWYSCARTQENGIGVTRQWRYWSGGKLQLLFSPATTDSVNHRWTLGGTRTVTDEGSGATRVIRLARADTNTLTVLRNVSDASGAAQQRRWDGVGAARDTTVKTSASGTVTYARTVFDTTQAVRWGVPRTTYRWPLGGTVIHNVKTVTTRADGSVQTYAHRAVVTFDGTATATVQVGALTCALDLATRKLGTCR